MPTTELNAYSAMLPVLQAQESIQRSNEIGVGTGSMKKSDRNKMVRLWNSQAGYAQKMRQAAKRRSGMFPSVGIGRR